MRLPRSRPHVGKVPMKFYFRAQDVTVDLRDTDIEGTLTLVWKRGYRRTSTEPFAIKEELSAIDGSLSRSASTSQDLAQICTMFKSSKSGTFESKVAKVSLEHVDGSRKGKQSNTRLGSASLDLSAYATVDMTSSNVELTFLDGRVTLRMTLCSHWLKNLAADATSDDSSVASFCTDADSDAGDSVRDDESVHSGGTDASGGAGARTADGSRGSKSLSSKRSSGQSSSCRAASTSSSPPAIAERSAPAATSKLRKAGGAMRGLGALGRSGSARAAPSTASGRAVPPGAGEGGGGARAPAGLGAGGLGADGGGNPFGGSVDKPAGYTPMDAGARAQMSAGRDAAIERMWADQENKVRSAAESDDLREEVRQLHDRLKHSYSEVKYLRQRMEQLSAENRVLRRDPRRGKRDAVIQQLEVELQANQQERADMEEQLSAAFGDVIKELQARINALTGERDRLVGGQEAANGKKGR